MRKKELTFTIANHGNYYDFAPFKEIICPYEKRARTQLDIYKDFVDFMKSPSTYIIDNTGRVFYKH